MIIEKIFDVATGQEIIIEREFTEQERAEREMAQSQIAEAKAKAELKAQQRADLLERLGISEEEAKLLLG